MCRKPNCGNPPRLCPGRGPMEDGRETGAAGFRKVVGKGIIKPPHLYPGRMLRGDGGNEEGVGASRGFDKVMGKGIFEPPHLCPGRKPNILRIPKLTVEFQKQPPRSQASLRVPKPGTTFQNQPPGFKSDPGIPEPAYSSNANP